jgi:hypothetical protein
MAEHEPNEPLHATLSGKQSSAICHCVLAHHRNPRQNKRPFGGDENFVTQCLLVVLVVVALTLCGCLFDGGSTTVLNAPVHAAQLCDAAPQGTSCPACSTPEGPRCRDQWYGSALRCTSDAQCEASGACRQGYCVGIDADGDGLDDDFEREVADLNFPKLLLADGESCADPHGVVYRARRHPLDPRRLAITYVVLYARDCGQFNGHAGDAETFSITVDLDAAPGAAATVGVKAWAHAGTTCGSTSSCETAPAMLACGEPGSTDSPPEVAIYSSRDKHATYLSTSTCADNCLDSCGGGTRIWGPLINVGEPDHPTVTDLTTQAFVQGAGWPDQLQHFNPWGTAEFAGGGRVDKPLTDEYAPPGR